MHNSPVYLWPNCASYRRTFIHLRTRPQTVALATLCKGLGANDGVFMAAAVFARGGVASAQVSRVSVILRPCVHHLLAAPGVASHYPCTRFRASCVFPFELRT